MNIRKNKETNNNKHTHTYKQRLNNQFHKGSMSAEESQGYVAETMYCIIFMKQNENEMILFTDGEELCYTEKFDYKEIWKNFSTLSTEQICNKLAGETQCQ